MSSEKDTLDRVAKANVRCPHLRMVLTTLAADPWVAQRTQVRRSVLALWLCGVLGASICAGLIWAHFDEARLGRFAQFVATIPMFGFQNIGNGFVPASALFFGILAVSWILSRFLPEDRRSTELSDAIFAYCEKYDATERIAALLRRSYEACDRSDDDVPNRWDVAQIQAYLAAAHRKSDAEAWAVSPRAIELIEACLPIIRTRVATPAAQLKEVSRFQEFVVLVLCFALVWGPLPQNHAVRRVVEKVFPKKPAVVDDDLPETEKEKKAEEVDVTPPADSAPEIVNKEKDSNPVAASVDGGMSQVDDNALKDYLSFVDTTLSEPPQSLPKGATGGGDEEISPLTVPKNLDKAISAAEKAANVKLTESERAQLTSFTGIPDIDTSKLSSEDAQAEEATKAKTFQSIREGKDPLATYAEFKKGEQEEIQRLDQEAQQLEKEAAESQRAAAEAARQAEVLRQQAEESKKREDEAKARASAQQDPDKQKEEEKEAERQRAEAQKKKEEAEKKEQEAKRQEEEAQKKKDEGKKKKDLSDKKKLRLAAIAVAFAISPALGLAILVLSLLGSKDGSDGPHDGDKGQESKPSEGEPGKPAPDNAKGGKGPPNSETPSEKGTENGPMDSETSGTKTGPAGNGKDAINSGLSVKDGVVTYTNPSTKKPTTLGKLPDGATKDDIIAFGDEANPFVVSTKDGVIYRSEPNKESGKPSELASDPAAGSKRAVDGSGRPVETPEERARRQLAHLLSQPEAKVVHNYQDPADEKRKAWFVTCKTAEGGLRLAWCGTGELLDGNLWDTPLQSTISEKMPSSGVSGKAEPSVAVMLDFLVSKNHQFPTNPELLARSLNFSIRENTCCLVALPRKDKPADAKGHSGKSQRHEVYLVTAGRESKAIETPIACLSDTSLRMLTREDGSLSDRGKLILVENVVVQGTDQAAASEWQIRPSGDWCLTAVSVESDGTVSFVVASTANVTAPTDVIRYLPPTASGKSPNWMQNTWEQIVARYGKRKALQASLYRKMPTELTLPKGSRGDEAGQWMDAWAMPAAGNLPTGFPAWQRDNLGEITLLFDFLK